MKSVLSFLVIFISASTFAQIDFLPADNYSLGSDIESVVIGDVNNDGLNDAIVATCFYFDPVNDYHIFVFLQNTDGTLALPVQYPYPESYGSKTAVKVADVNNDSLNDVILGYDNHIGIYFQNTSGTLNPIVSYYSGTDVDGIATGDLNNDQLTDIAVCHWNADYIKVFYQSIDEGFTSVDYPVESGGWDEIDIGDLNNDNLDDIVFMPGQSSEGTLIIFYQDSLSGINPSHTVLNYQKDYHNRFNGFGIGDLNNDGRNDIVGAIGGNSAWIALIYQDEYGELGEATYIDSYDIPTPVEIGDLNCDGKNEIVVGHRAWSHFSVFEQDALGNYNDYRLFGSLYYVSPYGLALGDYNNDSRMDVLTTNGSSRAYFVYNNSIPEDAIYSDTTVSYTTYNVDTTYTWTNIFYCNSIDTVNECLLQLHKECTETTNQIAYHIEGDSAIARVYEICGNYLEDTLHIEINISTSLLAIDTTFVIISVDTLVENYTLTESLSMYDTLNVNTGHVADTIVFEEVSLVNDTVYIVTDSLFVNSYVLFIEYQESIFDIYQGIKCGELISDTVMIFNFVNTNEIILESDTILISHTEAVYPYGINSFEGSKGFVVFPNPAINTISIKSESPCKIELYSLNGSLAVASEEKTIDISHLAKATYIAVIRNKKGRPIGTQKILKR